MRVRKAPALLVGVLVGLMGVSLWVFPVAGSTDTGDSVLRLHTDSDGNTAFIKGETTQPIVNGRRCLIAADSAAGPLVTLSADGSRGPGYIEGIGVKTGGANGTPCAQIDEDDRAPLTITSLDGEWISMELDLELKQNAKVKITVSGVGEEEGREAREFTLLTGASIDTDTLSDPDQTFPYRATVTSAAPVANCANPSDSGPDNGPNDNCRLTVLPDMPFDTVVIQAMTGAVSLEGGADFVDIDGYAAGAWDTIFNYAFCSGDQVTVQDGNVSGTFTLLTEDICKRYSASASSADGTVTFSPDGGGDATFRGQLTFDPEEIYPQPNALSLLQYDSDGDGPLGFSPMLVCVSPVFDGDGLVTSATIPDGESWCLVSVYAEANADGDLAPVFVVYGEGDPIFRIR